MAINTHVSEPAYSSEMLSFSFNPEILSFFGETPSDVNLELPGCSSQLISLRIVVPPPVSHNVTLFSLLHYSVVASGVVVLLGIGSYCAYQKIQGINSNFGGVKITLTGWSHRIAARISLLVRRLSSLVSYCQQRRLTKQISSDEKRSNAKKPNDLQLSGNLNGSSADRNNEKSKFTKFVMRNNAAKYNPAPKETDLVIGDDEDGEVQCHYFGPADSDQPRILDNIPE